MDFPHDQFGLPLADSYGSSVDLALISSEMDTFWKRQRRGYMHAASLVQVSFRVSIQQSGELVRWLQENDDWFNMQLLSGDSTAEALPVYPVNVRRTSTIASTRLPLRDATVVSFEVETNSMPDFDTLRQSTAGQPAFTYPSNLPLPKADGFVSTHQDRNVTVYSLTYEMNTATLKRWQEFAAFAGTAWFKHWLVSANTYGDYEVIRYTGTLDLALISPDNWLVTVTAEGYPNGGYLPEFASGPITECSYDFPIEYNDATEEYDCDGGGVTPPPQGVFTMPAGTVIIANSVTGVAPQTGTSSIRINRDGSIVCTPAGSPPWAQWHTNAPTIPNAGVTVLAAVEVSTNGTTWTTNVAGTRYEINTQDLYIRLVYSGSVDGSRALSVPLQFDDGTSTYAVVSATVQLSVTLDINLGGAGVLSDFDWNDYGEVTGSIMVVGIQAQPNGSCVASFDSATTDPWHDPIATGVGNGKWLVVTKTGGVGPGEVTNLGIRLDMSSPITYQLVIRNINNLEQVNWSFIGLCEIYSAQTGGTLLGSGTMTLEGVLSNPNPP